MDFLSWLRTVDFRVWISYLDVHFDYPNAVARLTVDRASAYGTPTCVFQINNSIGFLVGPPRIYLNKSRSFLSWLCSMHVGPLLPTQIYPWRSSRVCILNILGAAILIRFAIEVSQCELLLLIMRIFPAVVSCLLNPNLLSFAIVIAHFCFSPPAYCPGNLVFYTSRFLWLKIRLIAAFQKVYVRIHSFVYCCAAMLHFAPAHFTFLQQWNVSLKMVMQLRL